MCSQSVVYHFLETPTQPSVTWLVFIMVLSKPLHCTTQFHCCVCLDIPEWWFEFVSMGSESGFLELCLSESLIDWVLKGSIQAHRGGGKTPN